MPKQNNSQNTKRFTMLTKNPDKCLYVDNIKSFLSDVFIYDFASVSKATPDEVNPFIVVMPAHTPSVFAVYASSSDTPSYTFILYKGDFTTDLAKAAVDNGFNIKPYTGLVPPQSFQFTLSGNALSLFKLIMRA